MAKDRMRTENGVKKKERRIAAEHISHRYKRHAHTHTHTGVAHNGTQQ